MTIQCGLCGNAIDLPFRVAKGQHVRCPYCGQKFAYTSSVPRSGGDCVGQVCADIKKSVVKRKVNVKLLIVLGVSLLSLLVIGLVGIAIALMFFFGGNSGKSGGVDLNRQRVNAEKCPIGGTSVDAVLTSAEVGKAYFYEQGNLFVLQVLPKYGVLVSTHSLNGKNGSVALILTKREYIDGVDLHPGLYVCVGTARYPTTDGALKTVLAFEETNSKVAKQRRISFSKQIAEAEFQRQKIEEAARIEREAIARAEREATEATRIAAMKLKVETDAKLAKMRQEEEAAKEKLRAKAEEEALEAKAKIDAAAAEEAKKRYPEEQKMRAEYAANKLSAIKFDLKEYFIIEKAFLANLKSASVTEDAWRQMKKAAHEKNWLGVLSVASGEQLKDYPDTREIDNLIQLIVERKFHADFDWGRISNNNFLIENNMAPNCSGVFSEEWGIDSYPRSSNDLDDIIVFSIMNANNEDPLTKNGKRYGEGKILLYSGDNKKIQTARTAYCENLERLKKDISLGRINEEMADKKRHVFFEDFKQTIFSIMSQKGFKASNKADSRNDEETNANEFSVENNSATGKSFSAKKPAKKKREIDPNLKKFRGPNSGW